VFASLKEAEILKKADGGPKNLIQPPEFVWNQEIPLLARAMALAVGSSAWGPARA